MRSGRGSRYASGTSCERSLRSQLRVASYGLRVKEKAAAGFGLRADCTRFGFSRYAPSFELQEVAALPVTSCERSLRSQLRVARGRYAPSYELRVTGVEVIFPRNAGYRVKLHWPLRTTKEFCAFQSFSQLTVSLASHNHATRI
jgi:hypothetical protein